VGFEQSFQRKARRASPGYDLVVSSTAATRRQTQEAFLHGHGRRPLSATPDQEGEVGDVLTSLSIRTYLALVSLRDREDGQALVEYALLVSLIALASIGIIKTLGTDIKTVFSNIDSDL
jgi:Flp pilus assembly pilin Flp